MSCDFEDSFCDLDVTGIDSFKFVIERGTSFNSFEDGPGADHDNRNRLQ